MLYCLHYLVFRDAHSIFFYLLNDLAFVPIEVLLVTLIVHRVLNNREKRILLNKMNMVIGTFFSEVGTDLLKFLCLYHLESYDRKELLRFDPSWTDREFHTAQEKLRAFHPRIAIGKRHVQSLRDFLKSKRTFLLMLLENPNLLEHDSFTNLLWSVFHAADELISRRNLQNLSAEDMKHVTGDVQRVYSLLLVEWLSYMQHLKKHYPYLYAFAARNNPFRLCKSIGSRGKA